MVFFGTFPGSGGGVVLGVLLLGASAGLFILIFLLLWLLSFPGPVRCAFLLAFGRLKVVLPESLGGVILCFLFLDCQLPNLRKFVGRHEDGEGRVC